MGAEGLPARTRTLQVIEAIADGLDRIPFLYDTKAVTLEVGQGCTELTGDLFQVSDELFVTYYLARPGPGRGRDHHAGVLGDVPVPRETRTIRASASTGARSWGGWRTSTYASSSTPEAARRRVVGHLGRARRGHHPQEPVTLDTQHSAHRYLRFIEKTVAGFHWAW